MNDTINDATILTCGHTPSAHYAFSTGYGTDHAGHTYCYACCGERDRASMLAEGHSRRLPLYLQENEVTNWAGSLRFSIAHKKTGHHNIARTRTDVWFIGPDGKVWHGVNLGQDTQVVHCKRTKG